MKTFFSILMGLILTVPAIGSENLTVGSKAFTEGYLLGELLAQTIESDPNFKVTRRLGLGGTGILFEALSANEIQLYVEYTGTIAEAILKKPELKGFAEINNALATLGLIMAPPLGFNNTYALAVPATLAEKRKLSRISDLVKTANELRPGFSHEFMTRADGFKAMAQRYGLNFGGDVQSFEHSLAYEAVGDGSVDVIDVYSTDAKINKFNLRILEDDRKFFPKYEAVVLARKDFVEKYPELWSRLITLSTTIDEKTMRRLNAEVDLQGKSFNQTIRRYLRKTKKPELSPSPADEESEPSFLKNLIHRTKEHAFLVGLALLFSVLVGIPLGIVASRNQILGQSILLVSGLFQTIPSLALLCFLVPLFGIGTGPALVALCMYGLLPVITSTFVGLKAIDPKLKEMSRALGLTRPQRLLRIELPLASRSIVSGVRTSAIIGIGTATLAALIGAGGYGAPIVAGLAINDNSTILTGAVPAAVMALLAHALFEAVEHWIIPKGWR